MAGGVDLSRGGSLSNDSLKDLLKVTLDNHPWDGKFETLQKYHDYPVCNIWFQEGKVVFDGGTSIIRNVQVTENGSAKMTQPYEPEDPSVVDVQCRMQAEWRQSTANYSISRQEMMRNRSKAKLIDMVKSKRIATMEDIANLLEEKAWQCSTDTSDALEPWGIPYWINPILTAETADHNGDHHPSYSNCAGIDPDQSSGPDASRWKSYNDRWAAADSFEGKPITEEDVTKVARMLRRLKFRTPVYAKDAGEGSYKNLRLYTGEEVLEAMEVRARQQNDDLQNDLAKYSGSTVFKNLAIEWIEWLDYAKGNDTTYPFYAINHSYFHPFVMEGDFFRETGPMNDRRQHDVFTTFVDIQYNFMCTNRQRGGGMISAVVA